MAASFNLTLEILIVDRTQRAWHRILTAGFNLTLEILIVDRETDQGYAYKTVYVFQSHS